MQSKPIVIVVAIFLAIVLMTGVCSAGFVAGIALAPNLQKTVGETPVSLPNSQSTSSASSTENLFVPFWEAWDVVHQNYVDQPVDDEKLLQGAIRGMLEALGDPHTMYMDPQQYSDFTAPLEGYEGIGAFVDTQGEYLTIVEPIKGAPAEAAGLLPGDQVIAIDGEDMTGVLPEVARTKVLGPAGTSVTLTILRQGVEQPFDVTIERASITIPSIEYKMLDNDIAYIKLSSFSDQSGADLRAALEELMPQNPKGLIFDLRNNTGGYLPTAIDVASEFVKEGVIAYEEYSDGSRDTLNSNGKGIATDIPMVILVNDWSASASELVAGALQDLGRASLVGITTYGKGTVQTLVDLSNGEGAVKVTIARWLTPTGRNVTGVGLTPDYEGQLTQDDISAGKDPQLDKAIELLTNK
jgi:carboxyl-terminal processing protease